MEVRLAGDAYDVARAAAHDLKNAGNVPPQYAGVIEPLLAARGEAMKPHGTRWWVQLPDERLGDLNALLEVAKTHPSCDNMARRSLARMQAYLAVKLDPHRDEAPPPDSLLRATGGAVLDTLRRGHDQHVEMAQHEAEGERVAALSWMRGRWICRLVFFGGPVAPDDPKALAHLQAEPLVQFYDVRPAKVLGPVALVAVRRVSEVLTWTTTQRLNTWAPQYSMDMEEQVEFQNRIRHALAAPAQLPRCVRGWLGIRRELPTNGRHHA